MTDFAIERRIVPLRPVFWVPTDFGIEFGRDLLDKKLVRAWDKVRKLPGHLQERILQMSGSDGLWLSQKIAGAVDGGAAIGTPSSAQNWYAGLWTASIDGTMTGATAGETDYASYAKMTLLNSTTIFATGSTVSTEQNQNQWPADAAHNFATATGASTNPIIYIAKLNGNAGSSADKCGMWASVTSTAIANGDTPQLAQNAVTQTRD